MRSVRGTVVVTINDVAEFAGVGVEHGLAGPQRQPAGQPADPGARVLAAIDALAYRPSPLARGLSTGRCQTLGVVVPFFTHASAVERLRGVVAALDGSRYDLVLFNVETPVHRDEHFAALTRRDRADGLLVFSMPPPGGQLERLANAGVPVVLVDARGKDVDMVVTDDVEGGRIATGHLLALGHERIAFIGDDPANPFGFTASPARARLPQRCSARPASRSAPSSCATDRTTARSRSDSPNSCWPDATGPRRCSHRRTYRRLVCSPPPRAAGLRVPDDLSVVGFDDIEISAYAGLTTVRQPLFESGRIGAELLLAALDRDEGAERRTVRELPLELVERTTTGPPTRRRD